MHRTAKVDKSSGNVTLPVIFKEIFYEKIYGLHCSQRGHQGNILYFYYFIISIILLFISFIIYIINSGIRKTYQSVCQVYHGCTELIVAKFREFCFICNLNSVQHSQPRLTPIITNEIFERAQLDLIDMRCHPVLVEVMCVEGLCHIQYEWIGHMVDHSGQFHVLWAQSRKTGKF